MLSEDQALSLKMFIFALDTDNGVDEVHFRMLTGLLDSTETEGEYRRALTKIIQCTEGTDDRFYLPKGVAYDLKQEFGLL